jgi:hypothetical protein
MFELIRSRHIIVILSLISSSFAYHVTPIQYFPLLGRSHSGLQVFVYTIPYTIFLLQDFDVHRHFCLMKQSILSNQAFQRSFGKILASPG